MERLREWFGTPVAATKTIVWLCWVAVLACVLVSVLFGLLYLMAWGIEAIVR